MNDKICNIMGTKFGEEQSNMYLMMIDLYGLKHYIAYLHNHLENSMKHIGCTLCLVDTELWMKPVGKPDYGALYYSYFFCYVYDIFSIDNYASSVLQRLDKTSSFSLS